MNIQKSETLTLKTIFTKPVAINSTEVWKGIPEKLDPGRMVWALALLIWTKIAFSGQHWTKSSIENCEKVKFGEKVNFSNESVKKQTNFDLLFMIAIYSPQNVNKQSSEMKNKHQNGILKEAQLLSVWGPFFIQAKNYDLESNFSGNYFW